MFRRDVVGFVSYDAPIMWGTATGVPQLTFIGSGYNYVDRISAVDYDRDGVLDLVAEGFAYLQPHEMLVFRGLGTRAFTAPIVLDANLPLTNGIRKVMLADADADQDLDMLRYEYLNGPGQLMLLTNRTIRAPGCAGAGGVVPSCAVGLAHPGNADFAIGISAAAPNAAAVLGASTASIEVSGCGLAIDLAQLVLPKGSLGILSTDVAGEASLPLPLPPAPALSGMAFYVQWGVLDPQGAFPAAGFSFSLSDARTVYVW